MGVKEEKRNAEFPLISVRADPERGDERIVWPTRGSSGIRGCRGGVRPPPALAQNFPKNPYIFAHFQ